MTEDKGHYRCYAPKKFGAEALAMIGQANVIIDRYREQGFTLTLRQLHYQFVSRDLYANTVKNYSRLGDVVSDGRLAGLIDWLAIEDRGRNLRGVNTHQGPADAVKAARAGYAIDLWRDQEWRPEVWIEKEALVGVIGGICNQLRVDFFACKGYNSQSEQWRAGRRFADYVNRGQRPIVFHLGDHDPSGIDMTRDNRDRLSLFAGVPVTVVRIALNMPQIEQYGPPPNPAKMTDSRAKDYVDRFGDDSWELDALDPSVIRDLIADSVRQVRDPTRWDAALAREAGDLDTLDLIIEGL